MLFAEEAWLVGPHFMSMIPRCFLLLRSRRIFNSSRTLMLLWESDQFAHQLPKKQWCTDPMQWPLLDVILQSFLAKYDGFRIRYLRVTVDTTQLRKIDFQSLEDMVAKKFSCDNWNNVNMDSHRVLVLATFNSQDMHLPLKFHWPFKEVIKRIIVLLRAYLWIGCDKVTRRKMQGNLETVWRSMKLGDLGTMHLEKWAKDGFTFNGLMTLKLVSSLGTLVMNEIGTSLQQTQWSRSATERRKSLEQPHGHWVADQ
jgi:hypothetical protein